jgi:hypothetical protein
MGCGCRKNKTVQPVQQTQVQVQVQESTTNQPNQSGVQLTEQQQQQVDVIMDKLKKLNP